MLALKIIVDIENLDAKLIWIIINLRYFQVNIICQPNSKYLNFITIIFQFFTLVSSIFQCILSIS